MAKISNSWTEARTEVRAPHHRRVSVPSTLWPPFWQRLAGLGERMFDGPFTNAMLSSLSPAMTRLLTRTCLVVLVLAIAATQGQAEAVETIRGHLEAAAGQPPAEGKPLLLITSLPNDDDGKKISLIGDEFSEGQLRDPRLAGREWEFEGKFTADASFTIYKLFTMKEGKRHRVTYYCEICHIYTHEPGLCMCCQDETELQEILDE